MTNYYFDVDGVLADFHSAYDPANRAASMTYGFIRNLKPFVENIKVVKSLIEAGEMVFISTVVANEITKAARIAWLAEYLPEIPAERIITIVGYGNKADHMMTEDGILVDDKKANCRQWEKAGHKAMWLEVKGSRVAL